MFQTDRAAWLKGGNAHCNIPSPVAARPKHLILLGAPGVGKGTQAELLSQRFSACQLSTGDIFRAAKGADEGLVSPAMRCALECMRKGELVTDETVLALVAERAGCFTCGGGFLLDGFPRTVAQAEALEKVLAARRVELDAVISYELPLESIVARLAGRRTCMKCKAVFHVESRKPAKSGICDSCGSVLQQREDDKPAAIRVRMAAYQKNTAPLRDYYDRGNLLVCIRADGTPEQILERTVQALTPRIVEDDQQAKPR
jgi:adenylate kinase